MPGCSPHGWSKDIEEGAVVDDTRKIRAARTDGPLSAIVKTLALTLSKMESQEGI